MLYWYRVAAKVFCFAVFGIGALFLTPLLYIFPKYQRKIVSISFRVFIRIMLLTGVFKINFENKEKLDGLKGKIIVSNHNSILDVVLLISFIPNADCLVKSSLSSKHILQGITSKIYIPNSLDFYELNAAVSDSLKRGNNVIIFPEGKRISKGEPSVFKKGAARLALNYGCDIVPIHFGGNEKIGLRKGDKMLSFHPTEIYDYRLKILPAISMENYKNMLLKAATEKLTADLKEVLILG